MSAGVWFRKCLRLHDNAALTKAAESSDSVIPFFILDPTFDRSKIGVNRFHFLLESLRDLDEQLRERYNSRLLVFRGKPAEVLSELFEGSGEFRLGSLFYERDIEPYARARDAAVEDLAKKFKVPTMTFSGHTILDVDLVVQAPGFKPPIAMSSIQNLVKKHGPIPKATGAPKYLPALKVKGGGHKYDVPDLAELYEEEPTERHLMPGGEREALARLKRSCSDKDYIATFEKPKTESTGRQGAPWEPSTTGLSPYIKFGCISVRKVWHAIDDCLKGRKHSQPPMSLHGQLLFREMFYVLGASVPNLDKDKGNRMCKEIPWGHNQKVLSAWEEGRTGYPFIDALMRQLVQTGWMHHLGRHAVSCFLTRGDLWQNWTAGRDIFDKYLLDSDWAINNGNWLWLAGVAPWSAPYFRIYDPCPGPKTSLNAVHSADFIRHFVPELKGMPDRFLLTPWKAPDDVQKAAQCILGKDYPKPIVDHKSAREGNLSRFKAALESNRTGSSSKLPEKFGQRKTDPGPMRVAYSDKSATSVLESGQASGSISTSGGGRRVSAPEEDDDGRAKLKTGQEAGALKRPAAVAAGGARKRPATAATAAAATVTRGKSQ
uniref:6-4 photolyase n=1 Tax=Crypthecodinium cohnii TaxID=2866 RepID=A0A516AGK8_CRYCO|nr:6-4 photolyase [Crypthecodinium cohnii]USW07793.1 6-4 photolyase [Crypthecodinium cohnii]